MPLVQIDEMRKEFLSHVSHELKTPIALIQGYAEGLKDNVIEDDESKEFSLYVNMISTWGIVLPLSLAAAFWWRWPIAAVVICLQSDQIFKGIPIFLRFRSYKWIHKLTRV